MRKYGYSICAFARWEEDFIVEWLNYYREIGYDHVYLYCNDDDPRNLYERVLPFLGGRDPFVTFLYHPIQGRQLEMIKHFMENFLDESEYVSFLDIDEYLRLPRGCSIGEFVKTFHSDIDCILFNWIFFGPNGHKDRPAPSVLRGYTKREENIHLFTKYIGKSSRLDKNNSYHHWPGNHKDLKVVNVLGEDMQEYLDMPFDQRAVFVNEPERKARLLETAVIHHYAFRTEKAFEQRVARGLGGLFQGQGIWARVAQLPPDEFNSYLAGLNRVEDKSLCDFWDRVSARSLDANILRGVRYPISASKKATQSSVSQWSIQSTPEADAMGATNGVIDGKAKFHTDLEDSPWWMVDLGKAYQIEEIRIYNRMDDEGFARRASRLALETSLDGGNFREIYRRETDEPFGGVDGNPLVWQAPWPLVARFVRIRLLTRNYLHLDQVEVYGTEAPPLPEDFDPERYLALNEDVRAAGADPVQHWLERGQRESQGSLSPDVGFVQSANAKTIESKMIAKATEYSSQKMRVLAITMQRNEDHCLEPWIRHHGYIFGFENICILNHASTSSRTMDILSKYENAGINIVKLPPDTDYAKKGEITYEHFKKKIHETYYDFFFPIDCDELLFLEKEDGSLTADRYFIYNYLEAFHGFKGRLLIRTNYLRVLGYSGFFERQPYQKVFFFSEACKGLDHGNHMGIAENEEESIDTKFVYAHFHFRPYETTRKLALEKLRPFVDIDDMEALKSFEGPGHHLKSYLFLNEREYYDRFSISNAIYRKDINDHLVRIGIDPAFCDYVFGESGVEKIIKLGMTDVPPDFDPKGYLALNGDVRAAGVDPGKHWVEFGHREGRRWK